MLLTNDLFAEEWNTTRHNFITGIVAFADEDLERLALLTWIVMGSGVGPAA